MIENIHRIRQAQSDFFRSEATLDVSFRRKMLERFAEALDKWEERLCDALWTDLHKSYEEAYLTEISIVKAEVRTHLRKVKQWSRKRRVTTPLKLFPSQSYVVKEPLGNALIIAPWNYPMQLLLNPLVGAISAGCTAVLKPSPYVPTVSGVIAEMIKETFAEEYVAVVQGNRDVNKALLDERWDMIFFTGSPSLGKTVMAAAARNLTPVVLELGGKSPCIVDKSADIKVAARRIAWGKTLNSGQTCIAPDYILIHKEVKDEFVCAFAEAMRELHGDDLKSDRHYVRMVNDKAFERVASYIDGAKVLYGGDMDASERYIEPTLLDNPPLDSPVMTEEIFGPIFPMITIEGEFVDSLYIRAKTYMETVVKSTPDTLRDFARMLNVADSYRYEGGVWIYTETKVTCAGMPDNIKAKVNYDNFRIGETFEGKLEPVNVPGGVVLREKTYTMR